MDMKISQAFLGMAAPARRSLATLVQDWPGLVELARVAREEGPSEILNQIAGVTGVGPVAALALAHFFHEPHNLQRQACAAVVLNTVSVQQVCNGFAKSNVAANF